ncbi:hypothetical protein D3C85_1862190 [compost metagenome]
MPISICKSVTPTNLSKSVFNAVFICPSSVLLILPEVSIMNVRLYEPDATPPRSPTKTSAPALPAILPSTSTRFGFAMK